MAKKKDQNEDPEEEKKKQFDDDEDFGLPDLEYDALDEDATPAAADEPIDEELEAEVEAEVEASGHEDTLPEGDIDFEGEDWEKELEKELEADLKAGNFKEEKEVFYEEESYSDFETEEPVKSSVFEIDEKSEPTSKEKFVEEDKFVPPPSKKAAAAPAKPVTNKDYVAYYKEDKKGKSNFTRTVVIGVLLFTVVAIILIAVYSGSSTEEPKVVEKVVPPVEVKEEPPVEKPVEAPKKAQPVKVPAGQISTLPEKTGKTYVVIASFFDGDMAQDHANALSAAGKSPYIIPPFNDYRFYRVAIAEYDTFNDAKANLEDYKAEYGPDVWPLRY